MALCYVTFYADSFEQKIFLKNHKFSPKIGFFWKKDEFHHGLMGADGRDYAHSKENFFLYQNRLMRHPRASPVYMKNL